MTATRLSAKQRGTLKLLACSRDGANEELLRRQVIDFDVRLYRWAQHGPVTDVPVVRLTRSASLFLTHCGHKSGRDPAVQQPLTAESSAIVIIRAGEPSAAVVVIVAPT
jgi:hypothetical protein